MKHIHVLLCLKTNNVSQVYARPSQKCIYNEGKSLTIFLNKENLSLIKTINQQTNTQLYLRINLRRHNENILAF